MTFSVFLSNREGLNFLYKAENPYEYDGNNYRVFKQMPTEKTYYNYDGSGNLRFGRRGRTETENFEPLLGVVVSKNTERNNTQTAYFFIDKSHGRYELTKIS